VRYIEADQYVSIKGDEVETQANATWGIDRIDHANLPLSSTYTYFKSSGDGITAYIIDTGIFLGHEEFEGRAHFGINTVQGEDATDGNGHGTHVAGTIGGKTYGVAKKVTLIAVKVLSTYGSGTWAGVIAGVDWVTKDHNARNGKGRSVAYVVGWKWDADHG
jgi:subtilisin family serine protease